MRRCRSEIIYHGKLLRCHGWINHDSVHYSEGHWWQNEKGLPDSACYHPRLLDVLLWLAVAAVLALTVWICIRP